MMWILHIVALIFFLPALFVTIPLHLIMNNQNKNNEKIIEELKKKTYD